MDTSLCALGVRRLTPRIFLNSLFSAVLLVGAGTASHSHANHIDFIADGGFAPIVVIASGSSSDTQIGAAGNILGTEREITIDFGPTGSGALIAAGPGLPIAPGPVGPNTSLELLFSNSAGSKGNLTLLYDGVGSAGLGGLDFATLWNSIAVSVSDIQGAGDLSVIVRDSASNTGSATLSVALPNNYFFPFADPGYAGVDFSTVDSVEIKFSSTLAGTDVNISQITRETVIPEPTALALGALGLIGLAIGRRRS